MGFLCELFGFGTKPSRQQKQLRPARDPPEFKPGLLADAGILWVQFFRKLLVPKETAADYSKELGPPCSETALRNCRQAKKAKREKCKCRAKCNMKREEPKLVDTDRCKEYREKGEDRTELKAESFDTKPDDPSKCKNTPSSTTIHCNKCHRCTRIIDCTGHKNE